MELLRGPGYARQGISSSSVGLACIVFALCLAHTANCVQDNPLAGNPSAVLPGQGSSPPGTQLTISVSALLERALSLDTVNSRYGGAWWVILTWSDPRAGGDVALRTGNTSMDFATSCARACDSSGMASGGCCDSIWLPSLELPNMLEMDEDQLPRYRINANATSGLVTWSTRLVGSWYAPLDFRAYPFDHQHLILELAIADSQSHVAGLRWERVTTLNNTAHTKGADLAGWKVQWAKPKLYDSRTCHALYGVTAPRYDPAFSSIAVQDRHYALNTGVGSTSPEGCGSYENVYEEGRALYGPVVLVADVMIKRVSSYYLLANLVPVLVVALAALVAYGMPCDALGDRMGVVTTMLLSLTALQFLFDTPPSNYINALQSVVLASYLLMAIAVAESLIVNRLVNLSYALHNKRACVRKYSALLSRRQKPSGRVGRWDTGASIEDLASALAATGALPAASTDGADVQAVQRLPAAAHASATASTAKAKEKPLPLPSAAPFVQRGPESSSSSSSSTGSTAATGIRVRIATPSAPLQGERSSPHQHQQQSDTSNTETTERHLPPPGASFAGGEEQSASAADAGVADADGASWPQAGATTPAKLAAADGEAAAEVAGKARGTDSQGLGSVPLGLELEAEAVKAKPAAARRLPMAADSAIDFSGRRGARLPSPTLPQQYRATVAPPAASPDAAISATSAITATASLPRSLAPEAKPIASDTAPTVTADDHSPPAVAVALSDRPSPFAGATVTPIPHSARLRYVASGPASGARAGIAAGAKAGAFWWKRPAWWRRGSAAVARGCASAAAALKAWHRNIKEDPDFALFVAARLDKWCCIVSLALYMVGVSVLLWFMTQVGDHKLMLGDKPGNM